MVTMTVLLRKKCPVKYYVLYSTLKETMVPNFFEFFFFQIIEYPYSVYKTLKENFIPAKTTGEFKMEPLTIKHSTKM